MNCYTNLRLKAWLPRENIVAFWLLGMGQHPQKNYVTPKNIAHESVAARLQITAREHSFVSSSVFDGNESNSHIVQDG